MEINENKASEREARDDARETRGVVRDSVLAERRETYAQQLKSYMNVILWAAALLFALSVISIVRSYHLEDSVQKLDESTDQLTVQSEAAKEAAVEARDSLKHVLEVKEEGRRASPEEVIRALEAINRIEIQLCGGPCP